MSEEMDSGTSSSTDSGSSDQEKFKNKNDWWNEECRDATRAMRKALRDLKRNQRSSSLKRKYKKAKSFRRRVVRTTFETWYVFWVLSVQSI